MSPEMYAQIIAGVETLGAYGTIVRPMRGMGLPMLLQNVRRRETPCANITLVLSQTGVDAHMVRQRSLFVEGPLTHVTFEWFDSHVGGFVYR